MHCSRRRNVTTSMVGLKKANKQTNKHKTKQNKTKQTVIYATKLIQNGEPQRYSWGTQKKKKKKKKKKIQTADKTFPLTQLQYTRLSSPHAHPITPGAWQEIRLSFNVQVTGMTRPGKRSTAQAGIEPKCAALEADDLTSRPARRPTKGRGGRNPSVPLSRLTT